MREDIIKVFRYDSISEVERGDILIKDMCRVTIDLLDYRYTINHYIGDDTSTVVIDIVCQIKDSLALLLSDMEIYMDQMDITNKVRDKADKRLWKMADRVQKNEHGEM